MIKPEIEEFYPETKQQLREWFEQNHQSKEAFWLIYYKKHTDKPSLSWSEAVDEALCFGWIDSKAEPIDEDTYRQYFCKRKPSSTWSKINKQKIENLTSQGLMAPAGLHVIEIAKKNGNWTILDEVEDLIVPADLAKAFDKYEHADANFDALAKSKKKILLQWIVMAKTNATRQKRIEQIAENIAQNLMPKPFRPKK